MDPTEDLSARVLLQHILSTEPTRTPITRSASKARTTTATPSSARRSKKDARGQTPQDILRRSLRHKLRQSITRPSVTKAASASVVHGRLSTPAPTSLLLDDGDTPRHILRNILRTEPVKSPVVHGKEESPPSSADFSITGKRTSIELSGLDLPDITIGIAASTAKGLARKRPRRSFNVTAFEKRLKDGEDVGEENEQSIGDHSSLASLSSTSLSLKTPFVDLRTERKGLQRRVSNRRKITVEEFGAAVHKRQTGGVTSFVQEEQGLSETANSEGFTLGLSKLGEPDITTDILHCNTALYPQPESMTSSFSIIATQDKPTVMASQLQRLIEQEEPMEAERSELGEEKPTHAFPYEEGAEPENEEEEEDGAGSQTSVRSDADESEEEEIRVGTHTDAEDSPTEEEVAVESQTEGEHGGVDYQHEEDVDARTQSEEEEAAAEFRTDDEGAGDSQTEEEQGGVDYQHEEDIDARTQSEEEEEEEAAAELRTNDEGAGDSQTEDVAVEFLIGEEVVFESVIGEEVVVESQTEEEEEGGSQTEGELDGEDSQNEEDAAPDSQREEEDVFESQIEEEGAVDPRSVADVIEHQSDQEDPAADSGSEDEHDGRPEEDGAEPDLEHVSLRAQRSEGGAIMPVIVAGGDLADATEAGCSESRAYGSMEMNDHESGQRHMGVTEVTEAQRRTGAFYSEAESDADEENSFGLPEVAPDVEDGRHPSVGSPEVDAAQDSPEQVEEWEDEEDDEDSDEIPSKTPAFVKQKINFLQPDPLASPQFKNIQASSSTGEGFPAPKPKRVRKRGKGPAKKETDLPKSYLMAVFKHFAKTKVSTDVYPVLNEIMDKYFDRLAEDLETYAAHAKRKTIEVEDAELLLKRQGYVSDKVPVEVLIEKYLRMDQRKLLIPIATSGNVVIPKKRR
ncbi:protein IWS1 homolog A [Pungitius pungitius]|uniref:protein IWS1 homolog A n=1 Tax=Pungitius pungitius TaxID=134920 RepID=UPI002E130434